MSYRRIGLIAGLVLVLVLAGLGIARFQRKVEVRTGTKTVCTYGHAISDNIKTIKVPANQVGLYRVKTITTVCDKHRQAESLYEEAQQALEKGDVKTAKTKLTEVVDLDPDVGDAKTQLEKIVKGEKPAADNDGAEPDTKAPEQKPDPGDGGAIALTAWAPPSLEGFSAQKPLVEAMAVTRQYFPTSDERIVQLVIVAEQFKTSTGAKRALQDKVKARYSVDADSVTVGSRSAYYATDGARFAVIGFTQGAVMVAVELGVAPDTDPNTLKSLLVDVAKQLP